LKIELLYFKIIKATCIVSPESPTLAFGSKAYFEGGLLALSLVLFSLFSGYLFIFGKG
jgi:hypothetical protein